MQRLLAIIAIIATAAPNLYADDRATLSVFVMNDGAVVKAVHYAALGNSRCREYIVKTIDGNQISLNACAISKIEREIVPVNTLPVESRFEIESQQTSFAAYLRNREIRAQIRREVLEAKLHENEIATTLRRYDDEIAQYRSLKSDSERALDELPIQIARARAQYDAARTDLRSGYTSLGGRRNDLGSIMVDAATEKARLKASRKTYEQNISDADEKLSELFANRDEAQQSFDEARKRTLAAYDALKNAP